MTTAKESSDRKVGTLFLGRSFNALENEKAPEFFDDLEGFFTINGLRWFAPWILTVLKLLPVRSIQHFLEAQERTYLYGRKAFDEYIKKYGRSSGRMDLLTKMASATNDQTMTDEEIGNELGQMLVGATDPTVIVATWMLWELAQKPEWQHRMRDELRKNSVPFPGGVPSYKDIKQLPILNGFIMEGLRLHPAHSIGLPRIANTDTASIGGIALPKGVSHSLHSHHMSNASPRPPYQPNPAPSTETRRSTHPQTPSYPNAGSTPTAALKR